MIRTLVPILTAAVAVNAAVHDIDVGKGSALAFAPDTLTADVGDTLNFHFYSGSGGHSVVSSTFANPCVPDTNAFFSGYIPGDKTGDQTFIVNVTTTDPIWFYCSLGPHCLDGMVGVVNPPSGQTLSDYIDQASKTVIRASAPAAIQGGVLTTITSGSGSVTSTSSMTSTPTMTSMSSVTSMTGSSTSSEPGFSAGTTMPTTTSTSTGTAGSSASTSRATSTSSGVAATSTPSGGGKNREMPIVLGLSVIMAGLVSLMA
ncbi:uncharacterized protein PAC_18671 [Phialocephala subalpina]|uniref:Blue (type 1) copper domain-containing protein n=1 Tax=Phialocephala subalpina TaxID=576137 RepID=A0A1L7XUR4_9HELO|nr:uncharacterized protein PAC_18671 [Phialocephala subalpina]